MTNNFRIVIESWLEFESSDALRRNTLAEISIFAGNSCLTDIQDFNSKTTRKTIRVSAYDLAAWLTANFWRLHCETVPVFSSGADIDWQMGHYVSAAGGGCVWPDIVFLGIDGENMRVIANQDTLVIPSMSIKFLQPFDGIVDPASFENQISTFIETVINRLFETGVTDSPLSEAWEEVRTERANTKDRVFRSIEALLGLDPDSNLSLIEKLLGTWVPKFGMHAIEEIAASSGAQMVEKVLKSADQKSRGIKTHGNSTNLEKLRSTISEFQPAATRPWEFGASAANHLRIAWQLGSTPVTERVFSEQLGFTLRELNHVDVSLPFSFCVNDNGLGKFGFALSRHQSESRRFDIARLLGDQMIFESNERIKPATAATTIRQKIQRAFAAELLCPASVVLERTTKARTSDELATAFSQTATDYGVSETIVERHFQNYKGHYSTL